MSDEKDWEDEVIEIVNERFGADQGYSVSEALDRATRSADRLRDAFAASKAKIIMEDGTEIDIDPDSLELTLSDRELEENKLDQLEWRTVSIGPIEIEWTEVDGEVFERMFADIRAEQEQLGRIERFVFALRDVFMITVGSLVIALVMLWRGALERFGLGDR